MAVAIKKVGSWQWQLAVRGGANLKPSIFNAFYIDSRISKKESSIGMVLALRIRTPLW
jgi:hypothetical protein